MSSKNNVQTTMETLTRLIGPAESGRFLDQHWGKTPLHVARDQSDHYASLFSTAHLDEAIGFSISRDNCFLIKDGVSEVLSQRGTMKSLAEIYAGFTGGASLLVKRIHLRSRAIGELINAIAQEFGFNVDADIQAFPQSFESDQIQTSESECFVLQIASDVTWHFPEQADTPTITTQAGDTLYLPRGTKFTLQHDEGVAICLLIHVRAKTMRELLFRAIAQLAEKEVTFRRNVPFGMPVAKDNDGVMGHYIHEHVLPKLDGLDFEAARTRLSREVKRAMPALPDGHFTQMRLVDSINAGTELERRPGMTGAMTFVEDGVMFEFPGNFLQSPEKMFLAIEFLRTHPRFKVGDISGWFTEEEKILWAQHLVRKGYLRIAE